MTTGKVRFTIGLHPDTHKFLKSKCVDNRDLNTTIEKIIDEYRHFGPQHERMSKQIEDLQKLLDVGLRYGLAFDQLIQSGVVPEDVANKWLTFVEKGSVTFLPQE
jgi:hypothetical protein